MGNEIERRKFHETARIVKGQMLPDKKEAEQTNVDKRDFLYKLDKVILTDKSKLAGSEKE